MSNKRRDHASQPREDTIMMTSTIALISLLLPFAVQRFASRRYNGGVFVSALLGMAAAILLGGGLESGAYASATAVAVVVFSAVIALVTSVADPHADSSLNDAVFMAAENGAGAVSSIPQTMRVAAVPRNASRPVMTFTESTGVSSGFVRAA